MSSTIHPAAAVPPCAADKSKAAKAAKAVKKSQFKKTRKPRYSVVFHRPKTLVRSRDPKFPRTRCVPGDSGLVASNPTPCQAPADSWTGCFIMPTSLGGFQVVLDSMTQAAKRTAGCG